MALFSNRIPFKESFADFRDSRLNFSVSSRSLRPGIDILDYLRVFFAYCDIRQIESVFGSTLQPSPLYGGRVAESRYALTETHLERLTEQGIHLALTLTNHYFDEDAYTRSLPLLDAHHRKGNSVICTHDTLAIRLKQDFPLYEIKASIIKNLDSHDKIERALTLYDSLTLPMDMNDDDGFLSGIRQKERIILFGNANCAYTCPARTCYLGFSQENFGLPVTSGCSKEKLARTAMGHVYFNVKKFADMGFTRIKLVPLAPEGSLEACKKLSWKKGYLVGPIRANKKVHVLLSYPKCGRTWLRFILAQYFNRFFKLGISLDLHSLFTLMPTDDLDFTKGIGAYRFKDDKRFPLILASHHSPRSSKFDQDTATRRIIMIRSIPDVVVSNYFHRSRFMRWYNGELKAFIRSPKEGVAQYCRYLNNLASTEIQDNALFITYEKLHSDTENTVAGILDFLGIPVDPQILQAAVQLSSFDAMRAVEDEKGMPEHRTASGDPEGRRVRKGKVGGSADYLTPDDMAYIRDTCESLLSKEAKNLLNRLDLFRSRGEENGGRS